MRNVSWLICCTILLLIVTAGCDEDPVSVGEGILPPEDFVDVDTLTVYSVETFTFEHSLVTSGSPNIYAGSNDEVEIESVFRFTEFLPVRGVTPDTILASEFFDATLFLVPEYYLGDSSTVITVTLHEVLSGWTTTGFTREHFEALERDADPVSSASVMLGDTNAITFSLPRELIHRWAALGGQSVIPNGLIMKSDDPTHGIIGFRGASGENEPQLRIIYGAEEEPDTVMFSSNARAFAAYLQGDIGLHNNLIVQAGTSTRSVVRFDLSELPRNALIHSAELSLTRTDDQSILHHEIDDSLTAHHISDPFKLIPRTADAGQFSRIEDEDVTDRTLYRASVSEIVQAWLTVEQNNGFLIRDNRETLGFHRTSFYTEEAEDQEVRPRLQIIYSPLL